MDHGSETLARSSGRVDTMEGAGLAENGGASSLVAVVLLFSRRNMEPCPDSHMMGIIKVMVWYGMVLP
jgi:hypothetical protein